MMKLSGTRIATLGLLAAALVGLWKAMELDSWGFDGPGPGFFPQLMAGIMVTIMICVGIVCTDNGTVPKVPMIRLKVSQ